MTMKMKPKLTIDKLKAEAKQFCLAESKIKNKELFGVTDGKAVGTYVEHKFQQQLASKYEVEIGSSASGIDLPSASILTDIKVTSIKQPQSSCPFKDAKQKIFGLGYNLLVFVYDKKDDPTSETTVLDFVSCAFISKERTADYTTTFRLREMISDGANEEDIAAYLRDKNIPADDIVLGQLAKQILETMPQQGYLGGQIISYLPFQHIIDLSEDVSGISNLFSCRN